MYLSYLLVFLSAIALDVIWTRYISAVGAKHAHGAAFWSALTFLFAGFNIFTYSHDPWALIPVMLGGYVGTWGAVRFKK